MNITSPGSLNRNNIGLETNFLAVSWGCLRFVIVVFPDHTYLLFLVLQMRIFSHPSVLTFVLGQFMRICGDKQTF